MIAYYLYSINNDADALIECFTRSGSKSFCYMDKSVLLEKYTTGKTHTIAKPHPGFGWRIFHILTSEDVDYFTNIKFVA